ncbi:protein CCA1 [Cocos nucifera]|nr:protein CCA1 [Cocos nucifera]
MHVDVKTKSTCALQLNEVSSYGDEHIPKVRKPYTLTKQREKWTEEEHKKFLDALQLYGRAWRRIEEHIGTKTAVQIRSHAQKFFSKVVRESAGNSASTLQPIEIPPPRPKRKPLHPYPRNLGRTSSNGIPVLKQLEKPSLQIPSPNEQENGSPTSVLSTIGSANLGSTFLNLPDSCTSPVASAAESNEQDDGDQSPTMSVGEENKSQSLASGAIWLTIGEQPAEELGQHTDGHVHTEEISSMEAPETNLKLFARTVLVSDSDKPSSSSTGDMVQFVKPSPTVDLEIHHGSSDVNLHAPTELPLQSATHEDLSEVQGRAWNPWDGGMHPLIYGLPFVGENTTVTTFLSLPWWCFCRNLPFLFIHQQNTSITKHPPQSWTGRVDDKEIQRECSWTGSNTASVGEVGIGDQNAVVDSPKADNPMKKLAPTMGPKPTDHSTFDIKNSGSDKPTRGFVPYKRCAVEREVQHSQTSNEDGEDQMIRLCL